MKLKFSVILLSACATLVACGGGGRDSNTSAASTQGSQQASVAAPSVNLHLASDTVDQGGSTVLSWSATDANQCSASGGWIGTVPTSGTRTVSPDATSDFVLECTGAGGSTSRTATVAVVSRVAATSAAATKTTAAATTTSASTAATTAASTKATSSATSATVTAAPTVSISVGPASIGSGGNALLTWSSTNAAACAASGAWTGAINTSGTLSVSPTSTSSYVLTCTGSGGSTNATTSVTVASAPTPTVAMRTSQGSIAPGDSSVLFWSSTNTTACVETGDWSGLPTSSGALTFTLSSNANYLLTCTGPGGAASADTTIAVTSAATPLPAVTMAASPSVVTQGANTTLSWSTTGATACTASGAWSGSEPTSGSATVAVAASGTYTLTCSGAGGSTSNALTVTALPPVSVALSANPANLVQGGSTTLNWSSSGATACAASGGWSGSEPSSGSLSVSPSATTSYTLACSGSGGNASSSATVTVTPVPPPSISLSASPATIAAGGSSTLTWSTTGATSCAASSDWPGSLALAGSASTGALNASTSYTLTCTGIGGQQSATTNVSVQASVAPTAASASTLGPLTVQSYMSGIVVPTGARFQSPTIWYPSGGVGPYPGVVYVPGYASDYLNPKAPLAETTVTEWAQLLASHGFVVMFVNSASIPTDSPPQKANALLDAVSALIAEAGRTGSPITGLLQTSNIAVMGHSFGGAGALFAANSGTNPNIKAVLALSPVPNNNAYGPYPNLAVPALILASSYDALYPAAGYEGEYNSIPATTSRMIALIPNNPQFSSQHDVARVPLGTHSTDPLVARYGLSFLETYLVHDTRYQQFLVTDPSLFYFSYTP